MASKSTAQGSSHSGGILRRSIRWLVDFGPQQALSVTLGVAAVLSFLTFVSYSPADLPDWVPFSGEGSSRAGGNVLGPIGALLAGYAYFFFGASCFLIPAVLLWWSVQVMATRRFLHSRNFVAFALFLLAASCLIEYQTVLFRDWVSIYNLPRSAGGFFGHVLGKSFFARYLGEGGAFLLMVLVYLATLLIITGIHPLRFFHLIRKRSGHHYQNLKKRERNSTKTEPVLKLPPREKQKVPDRNRKIVDASGIAHKQRSASKASTLVPDEKPQPSFPLYPDYQLPPLELLDYPAIPKGAQFLDKEALIAVQNVIVSTLKSFGLEVEPGDITKGPTITRYELYPAPGLRVNRITALKADIARATRAERINILAPIPGSDTVGIEIANSSRIPVALRDLLEDKSFKNSPTHLPLVLGKDVYGQTIIGDLAKMPHVLIAGATGTGKSVCVNSIIASLLYRFTPDELQFIMIDPKVVEMQLYNPLPHMVIPVVTDPKRVILALRWLITEMERRYELFAKNGVRNFEGYNQLAKPGNEPNPFAPDSESDAPGEANLPYIVVIIDELADLMQTAPADVETGIARIAQKARAAGIHLIIATQTPRADVVTGIIKANIPCRIAFQVSSKTDSRIILDENGAENLIGKGDLLYLPPGTSQLVRAQGALITDRETQRLVDACASQGSPLFQDTDFAHDPLEIADREENNGVSEADEELISKCLEVIYTEKRASTSLLQRRLRLGYNRAARMIDILQERGIVGPGEGARPREILVDLSGD